MKIALVIGHHPSSQGAVSVEGDPEFDFYDEEHDGVLGEKCDGFVDDLIALYTGPHDLIKVYRESFSMPYRELNELGPDFFISFHFNSASNPSATGSEVLFYPSEMSTKIAKVMIKHIKNALDLPLRGHHGDGLLPRTMGRGASLLAKTKMPGVLLEPFFGSNPHDWKRVKENYDFFLEEMLDAIDEAARLFE